MRPALRWQAYCLFFFFAAASLRAEEPARSTFTFQKRGGLPNVEAKLAAGQPVTIAYLGGSITLQNGWRVLIGKWFADTYPKATVNNVCAAIGGTGSDLGAYRLHDDVLVHQPDLLFVEFAVNDFMSFPSDIRSNMEGIVRQTWTASPTTDICFVYTISEPMLPDYTAGRLPPSASAHEDVADHYDIPSICMGYQIPAMIQSGKLIFKHATPSTEAEKAQLAGKILFTGDGTHPYETTGHPVYLAALTNALPDILATGTPGAHALGAPLVTPNAENAHLVPIGDLQRTGSWVKLDPATDPLAKRFQGNLPTLWKAATPGDSLSFRFRGTAFGIFGLFGPACGNVETVVDGKTSKTSFFDPYSGDYRVCSNILASGLPDQEHTVTITVLAEQPDKLSILLPQDKARLTSDPQKFNSSTLYADALMLRGEIIP